MARTILVVDDDPTLGEALVEVLQRDDRRIILCSDPESASVVLSRIPVSVVVTDLRLNPPFGYEGLDLLRTATDLQPNTLLVAMTGLADGMLEASARDHGAGMVLLKPFGMDSLGFVIDGSAEVEVPSALVVATAPIRFPVMTRALVERDFVPVFQPILELSSMAIAGAEALARHRKPMPMNDIQWTIAYMERRGTIAELDLALLGGTFESAGEWARNAPLFLNVHPATLGKPDKLVPRILLEAERHRIPMSNLVIEITEHAALPNSSKVIDCITELRAAGARFALDDVGVAYSHLTLIDRIRPSFLKISQEFGTGFENDLTRCRLVRSIHSLATDFGIDVILEGVEDGSTAAAARDLGIRYGQGYHFARPGSIEALDRRVAA